MSEAMHEGGARDTAAMVMVGLALVFGVIQWIYLPFLFGPAALVSLIVAVMLSPRPRSLYTAASLLITIGFVVGASFAAGTDRSLY